MMTVSILWLIFFNLISYYLPKTFYLKNKMQSKNPIYMWLTCEICLSFLFGMTLVSWFASPSKFFFNIDFFFNFIFDTIISFLTLILLIVSLSLTKKMYKLIFPTNL